ncbi:MAG: protein kinase [Acidobacteriota bacterium]
MKKNILLVEYDLPTIEIVKELLSNPIFDLTIAEEGETAKKLLSNKKFDLLISAAMLPKFHGFDLSKYSRKKYPDTKVIIISGVYKGVEYKNQAISEFNADDFFEKPLDKKEFLNSVLHFLNINEKDLEQSVNKSATQIPLADTKKIPAIKNEKEEESKLTSEDIFGDIIDKVEQSPHEIKLEESEIPNDATQLIKDGPATTQILDEKYLKGDTKINDRSGSNYKERDINFQDLVKTELKSENKETKKKIEDDILKKFDDTLSGLGLSVEKPSGKEIKKDIKTEKKEEVKTTPVEPEKESGDEIEGYEILDLIARGGMAEIYKAKKKGAKGFEKIVVIKKILSGYGDDDKYIEMFVDEAKIAAELSHSNIVQIYDFGKKDNYYFIAMEYIEGKDLRLMIRKLQEKNEHLEEYLSVYIILKILEALSYAHSAKDKKGKPLDIVHRDISPPNIIISYSGDVKLTDFGVSKASNKMHQTLSGALKGKLLYMSPEQAKAEKNIDNRSDIYSVGAILFELLTGKKLFKGSSEMEVLNKVQEGEITIPEEIIKDINPELEKIILKALEKDKGKRFKNASEMIKALESYIYKTYNYSATPIHLTNRIHKLFKSDIVKEGILVTPKSIPYEIEKLVVPEPEPDIKPEVKPEVKPEIEPEVKHKAEPEKIKDKEINNEVIDLKEEDKIIEPEAEDLQIPDNNKSDNIPQDPIEAENEKEHIEIEFEKEEEQIGDELIIQRAVQEDFKNKKKIRPLFFIFLVLTTIAAFTYYFFFREKDLSISLDKPPVEKVSTKLTEQKKEDSKTLIPDNINTITDEKQGTIPESLTVNGDSENIGIQDPALENKALISEEISDEEKKQEDIKKLEIQKKQEEERIRKDKERKKRAEAARKKKIAEEEKQKKAEEELRLQAEADRQKKEIEQKRQDEEAKKKKEEELRKKLEEEKNKAKPGQIFSLNVVDTKPEPVNTPPPKLTRSLRVKVNQTLLASFLIDHNGNIEKVRLIKKSNNKKINNIIINTIKNWTYKAAIKDGVKVKVWKTIPINIKK